MSLRSTTQSLSVLGKVAPPNLRVTREELRVLGYSATPSVRATQATLMVLSKPPPSHLYISRVELRVLCTHTPLYGFTQVIFTDVFPKDISYNSVASVRFATDVIIVDSGDDQRVGRWDQPLQEYDVAYGVRTMEDLTGLIAFFRAMKGRLYGFNYQDNVDYTSSYALAFEARSAAPITNMDQTIGVGNGVLVDFQLIKVYATNSSSNVRPITRPQPGTTIIALNGVPYVYWTVDEETGIVTFTPPASVDISGHGCAKDALNGVSEGSSNATITGLAGDFSPLATFTGRPCSVLGWANPLNNVAINDPPTPPVPCILESVAGDGSSCVIQYPAGYGNPIESAVVGINIAIGAAPLNDVVITAGFWFYVPVRFDTDTLATTIEDYGVGGANSVKLIEVRSSDPS